jgi:hypothetical protein
LESHSLIYELWQWLLYPNNAGVFNEFTKLANDGLLGKIEFVFNYNGNYVVVNLGMLFGARKPVRKKSLKIQHGRLGQKRGNEFQLQLLLEISFYS